MIIRVPVDATTIILWELPEKMVKTIVYHLQSIDRAIDGMSDDSCTDTIDDHIISVDVLLDDATKMWENKRFVANEAFTRALGNALEKAMSVHT